MTQTGQTATDFISAASRQIDLLTTLAIAIAAATIAGALQIALHNADPAKEQVTLGYMWFMHGSLILQAAAIVSGFIAKGFLAGAIPSIHRTNFNSDWQASLKQDKSYTSMMTAARIQAVSLLFGFLCLLFLM